MSFFKSMIKNKTYWVYHFSGWALFALINIFFGILYSRINSIFFLRIAFFVGAGIIFSHLMKMTFDKLNLLKKPIQQQILSSLVIIFFFAILSAATINWLYKTFGALTQPEKKISLLKVILGSSFSWFMLLFMWSCIYFIYHYIQNIRKEQQQKIEAQQNLLELKAKALRAQMNPHFIFNCLNSIKSLILEDRKEKSVAYLTTFSKLIRALFNNADKKEITLYDEIETCKLYLKLESMRFDSMFFYYVSVAPEIDAKSILVPALIIQPFIENAIWHGIMPKDSAGEVGISVLKKNNSIIIVVDDDGIGREVSYRNKSGMELTHRSKGVYLTASRLELDELITKRKVSLEIIDKKNDTGIAQGTKVILTFEERLT